MTRAELKSNAKMQLSDKWLVVAFKICAIQVVLGLFSYIPLLAPLLAILVAGVAQICLSSVALGVVYNNPDFNITTPFKDMRVLLKATMLGIITTILIGIGVELFIIPGVIVALSLSQVMYILLENPDLSIGECIKESRKMMKGHKLELFMLQLSFFGLFLLLTVPFLTIAILFLNGIVFSITILVIVFLITAAIIVIFIVTYSTIVLANFYDSIKQPSSFGHQYGEY